MRDIEIHGVRMRSKNPAVKIDLGGVAKGFAIDRLLRYLKSKGINNALINTGGDLKVIGRHGDRPWKVAIRDPRYDPKNKDSGTQSSSPGVVASLDVMDEEAVFTSGDYERYVRNKNNKDKHLHHIIDPRTGYPAQGSESVTVICEDASTADAAATAIFVAGPKQWVEIAKDMGVKQVLLIDTDGNVHISTAMEARVKFEEKRKIVERAKL
jgi:thiamine biosynthesis lipoprotein